MYRELIYLILALAVSLVCVTPAYGDDVTWDFENGNDHGFTLWSVNPATAAAADPTTAGDEALTGVGGPKGLPDAGVVWSIGRPDQYDGQKPTVSEGDKAKADGTMEYNQPGKNHPFTFPVNNRGQESYLNTYNLTEWGDNVHAAANDQIATSPLLLIGSNAQLTVWVHGGGSGTHAPELDSNSDQGYTTNSAGVAVLSAADGSLLGSVLTNGHGTLREDTIDLSDLTGQMVYIEVVDAFQGGWGWIAVDEIRITNAIELGDAGPFPKAWGPNPANGALHTDTWANLSWIAGGFAVSHDIYLGDNFDDVNDGVGDTFRGNQAATFLVVGFPGFAYPDGLVPGTTYYWRIDEVNDAEPNSPWKGDVWSFSIPPRKAYNPEPAEGAKFIAPEATLSWTGGMGAKLHTVYFGDNFDDVSNATVGIPQGTTTFSPPGLLGAGKVYYWRVDEFDGIATYQGDVWSFTTAGEGGGVKGKYFSGMDFGNLVLTRIDPQINFSWGNGEPDPSVGPDNFSCRWTGEVEAAFTETYTFYTNSDDGVRLWIDGQQLVNNWTNHSATENKGTIDLVAGNTYSLLMELYEDGGGAVAELRWSSPRTPKQLIPQAALSLPVKAGQPNPSNGAVDVKQTSILSWSAGEAVASHDVYFGTDADAVKDADTSSPEYKGSRQLGSESYDPGKLEWNITYYWRVDEIEDGSTIQKGNIWSFTTANFLIVDDMESYNDIDPDDPSSNRIFNAWIDGFNNPAVNGSVVGNLDPPFAEQTIVHSGNQSMPFEYNNAVGKSEATLTLTDTRDWTENGVDTLVIWYIGDAANVPETMYVVLNGTAGVDNDNPNAALANEWTEWSIDLQTFGTNLTNVNTITLGFGNRSNPVAGGSGMVIFDDIRLYRPAP